METIYPLYDYIVCRRIQREEKSNGGIIITQDSETRNIQYAIVEAVGCGRKNHDGSVTELEVKIGDTIIMAKFGGTDIGGDKFLIKEDHVFAVISEID